MERQILASVGALILVSGVASAQPKQYIAIDLGTGFNSTPTGINESRQVVGNYQSGNGQYRAFRWNGGSFQDAGSLSGMTQAAGVNAQGVAVGLSVNSQNQQRAVRIDVNGITDLGALPNAQAAVALGINSDGWIVGSTMVPGGVTSVYRATLWRNGSIIDIGTLGGTQAEARGISDGGHIVGWATTTSAGQHAFRWTQSGGMVDLGTLGGTGSNSFAFAANTQGTVVGASMSPTGYRGFIWTPQTGMQGLPVLPGFVESWASSVNNANQVVGYSSAPGGDDCETIFEPTLWENGAAIALNQHITGNITLHSVLDINDRGEIVGLSTGGTAVLLVPAAGCSADFNGDGDVGTDGDIEAFFACLAGSCCQACGGADFNGDGDVGTDADIDSFFRVLAGGPC